MKEMIILIVMMFPEYGVYPDSVAIREYDGKPLVFTSTDKCEEWIYYSYSKEWTKGCFN